MTAETFATALRRLRIERGLSQNALAKLAGIDPAYINRLERVGAVSGTIGRPIVLALATALDLSNVERDQLLYAAGLAPERDYQALYEDAEAALQAVRAALGMLAAPAEPTLLRRQAG